MAADDVDARLLYEQGQGQLYTAELDPLSLWSFSSDESRDAVAKLGAAKVFVRGGNLVGKSELLAAVAASLCQRRETLDGVPLPWMPKQPEGMIFVRDTTVQRLSTGPALTRMLGRWPHRVSWTNRSEGVASSVRIQQRGNASDDESTWAALHFLTQKNPEAGVGARGDFRLFDEPPLERHWDESGKMAHAGRQDVALTGFTPIRRREWRWIKRRVTEAVGNRSGVVVGGQVEYVIPTAHNRAIPRWQIEALERQYAGTPLYRARLYGDYCDTEGDNPLNPNGLDALESVCVPGREWVVEVPSTVDLPTGRRRIVREATVHVWFKGERGERYYIPCDGSAGIRDAAGLHDPCAAHVKRESDGATVASYEGYIGGYGLGVLAAFLGREYGAKSGCRGDAWVDPETQGGWGESILDGLMDARYSNVASERDSEGRWKGKLGFGTTVHSRPRKIAALIEWVEAWAQGERYAPVWDVRIVRHLRDLVLDEADKLLAQPGAHDEHAILMGQGLLRLTERRPKREEAAVAEIEDPTLRKILRERDEALTGGVRAPSVGRGGRSLRGPR